MSTHWSPRRPNYSADGGYGATSRRASMARSRRLLGRRFLLGGGLILGVLLLMTGQIALSNGILAQRCRLAELEADRAYYQARIGSLELAWNRATTRESVVARAEAELGLVLRSDPARLVVLDPSTVEAESHVWPDWLTGLGGGTEAQAATARRHP